METTYTVLGGDGAQYGPVNADQFREWARAGRVNGETKVRRNDQADWVTAASLSELGVPASPSVPVEAPHVVTIPNRDAELESRVRSGASWFYWIAAMSLINSILVMTGSGWGFALGLGLTQIIDHTIGSAANSTKAVVFAIDLVAAGIVALFGYFAHQKYAWAFVVGMFVLLLDTALTVLIQAWLSTAFHAWALFSIFMAFKASRALRAGERV